MSEETASPEAEEAEEVPTSLLEKLNQNRLLVVAAIVTIAVAVLIGYHFANGGTVPRWLKIAVVAGVVSVPLGAPALSKIVNWLYAPNYVYLVDFDPTGPHGFAVWELPPARWRELVVQEEGELHQLPSKVTAYEVETYDPEENVAKTTWRGSATDSQLLDFETKVDEVRGELERKAHEGRILRITRTRTIRSALDRVLESFIDSFEEEAIFKGEEISKAFDEALADHGLAPPSKKAAEDVGDDRSESSPNVGSLEFVFPNTNGDLDGDLVQEAGGVE